MTFKTLEVRDTATRIDVMVFRMLAENLTQAHYVHDRNGHPRDGRSVVMMKIYDQLATNDPWEWEGRGGGRTLQVAHQYVLDHFDELIDGDVIDVEFILGETKEKKRAERLDAVARRS
jgi:hypothetical protein